MVYTEEHEREMVYVSFFVCNARNTLSVKVVSGNNKIMRDQGQTTTT